MKLPKLLRLLLPNCITPSSLERVGVRWLALFILLLSTPALHAQEKIDSTAKAPAAQQSAEQDEATKPEKKSKGKKKEKAAKAETPNADAASDSTSTKPESKKKGKGSKMDQILAEKKAEDAASSDSSQITIKGKKSAKANPKKSKLPPPPAEPKIIPGAEARANADTKDKEDRTMKGPSGQKVYSSPKGGKYYFDVNGNKKYLKRDNQK